MTGPVFDPVDGKRIDTPSDPWEQVASKSFAPALGDGVEEYAEKAAVERCPRCGHQPHQQPCLNMASDNDCDCPGDAPPEPSADVEALAEIVCPCGHGIQSHTWSGCVAYMRPTIGGAGACCTRTPTEVVLSSDWLAAHTAAAEARGAQAVVKAVVSEASSWMTQWYPASESGSLVHAATHRVLAAAREAARNAGGGRTETGPPPPHMDTPSDLQTGVTGPMPWPTECDHTRQTCEEVGCPNADTPPPKTAPFVPSSQCGPHCGDDLPGVTLHCRKTCCHERSAGQEVES